MTYTVYITLSYILVSAMQFEQFTVYTSYHSVSGLVTR